MKDEFNNNKGPSSRDIVTKKEGEKIEKVLKNMKMRPQYNHPAPKGMESLSSVEHRYRTMLQRRNKHINRTLNQASRDMSQSWDRNS